MKRVLPVAALIAIFAADAFAQQIPSSARAGRERQQLIGDPFPQTPRIQMQDGRPAPVVTKRGATKPAKQRQRKRAR